MCVSHLILSSPCFLSWHFSSYILLFSCRSRYLAANLLFCSTIFCSLVHTRDLWKIELEVGHEWGPQSDKPQSNFVENEQLPLSPARGRTPTRGKKLSGGRNLIYLERELNYQKNNTSLPRKLMFVCGDMPSDIDIAARDVWVSGDELEVNLFVVCRRTRFYSHQRGLISDSFSRRINQFRKFLEMPLSPGH